MKELAINKPVPNKASLPDRELFSVPLDLICRNRTLKYPIYLRVNDKPVLFRPEGDKLSSERADRLKARIDHVAIPKSYLSKFLNAVEGSIASDVSEASNKGEEAANRLRGLMVALGTSLQEHSQTHYSTLAKLNHLAGRVAVTLRNNPGLAKNLIRRYSNSAMYFANHNVNVAIYGAMMGFKLGLSLPEVKVLTYGCLVHNIGNVFVPDEILYKAGPLTILEWVEIQSHPQKGAALMESFHAPVEIVKMIRQHHERFDGKGYPGSLAGKQIHIFARVCEIGRAHV